MAISLRSKQLLEMALDVYTEKEKGFDDSQIMEMLGVDAETYQQIVDLMYSNKVEELHRRKPEEHYVAYCLEQKKTIRKLEEIIENSEDQNSNTVVRALTLRADIVDRIVARGQEFGVLVKAPEKRQIVGGIVIADLSKKELKSNITKELGQLKDLMRQYGDTDIKALPEPPLYYGEGVIETTIESSSEPIKTGKTARAKNTRRFGGGKVRSRLQTPKP